MKQEDYRSCIAKGLTGKTLKPEERKLEFCVVAKLCSKKASSREEAERLCSLPKEPKPLKTSSRKSSNPKSCEKEVTELAHCIVDKIDMDLAHNINSIEVAIINAMMKCRCKQTPTQKI